MKDDDELAGLFMPVVREKGFSPDHELLKKIVSLVKERAGFINELWHESDFFFMAPQSYNEEVVKKRWNQDSPRQIVELRGVVADTNPFDTANLEQRVKEWIQANSYNTGSILNLFRLLLVGASRGPHLFDIAGIIGREETLRRLDTGIRRLS